MSKSLGFAHLASEQLLKEHQMTRGLSTNHSEIVLADGLSTNHSEIVLADGLSTNHSEIVL